MKKCVVFWYIDLPTYIHMAAYMTTNVDDTIVSLALAGCIPRGSATRGQQMYLILEAAGDAVLFCGAGRDGVINHDSNIPQGSARTPLSRGNRTQSPHLLELRKSYVSRDFPV